MSYLKDKTVIKDLEYIAEKLQDVWPVFAGTRILLTGAGGFLGHYLGLLPHFMNRHFREKTQVTLLDKSFTRAPWFSGISCPEIKFITTDFLNYEIKEQYDWIFHAATYASPVTYRKFPLETFWANLRGMEKILQHAIGSTSLKGVLNFSSSEIYGNPPNTAIPTHEEYQGQVATIGPRASYDESKRATETLTYLYWQQYKVPVKIVRPFNHYGPGLIPHDGRVLADFILQILHQRDLNLFSDGSPSRSFCYVADAIVAYYRTLALAPSAIPINIGNSSGEITIIDLARKCVSLAAKHFNYQGQILFQQAQELDYLTDNPQRRCPNTDRMYQLLKISTQVPLDDGLLRYFTWCHDNQHLFKS